MSVLAWIRWRRDLRGLRREAAIAYDRWIRARHAYQDTAIVFAGQPGAWSASGKAQDELMDRMNEYLALTAKIRRLEQVGP